MSVSPDLTQRNIFRQGHSHSLSPRRQNREQNITDTAKITLGDKIVDSPVLSGTVGPDVVDIRKFYAQTGAFPYDPGFTSTASCESPLTYIDGEDRKSTPLHSTH